MVVKGAVALFALFVMSSGAASAAVVASQASPGAVLNVEISIDNDGRVMYSVARKGKQVIQPSQLGFLLTDAPKLDRNFGKSIATAMTRTGKHSRTPWWWSDAWCSGATRSLWVSPRAAGRRFVLSRGNEANNLLTQ